MVDVSQGEIWWADLPAPAGSAPGFRRPVVTVQGNHLNRGRIATAVCVPVANASQIIAVDRAFLAEQIDLTGDSQGNPKLAEIGHSQRDSPGMCGEQATNR